MENDKKDGSGLALNLPVILLLLAAAGNLFWTQSPLVTWRPNEPASNVSEPSRDQAVRARLWEDPFSVLQESTNSRPLWTTSLASQVTERSTNLSILAVMVPGGPYADDREWRVRSRFAVLSALATTSYVPEDGEHVGWLRNGEPGKHSSETQTSTHNIPFEWFTKTTGNDMSNQAHVLVLWLKDENFEDAPLGNVGQLMLQLGLPKDVSIKIIGPRTSTGLRNLWEKEAQRHDADVATVFTNRTDIYSASATLADWRLFREDPGVSKNREKLISKLRQNYGITFHNAICTDDQTAAALVQELSYRGLDWNKQYHVALISEWDSTYGRSLPEAFTNSIAHARDTYFVGRPDPGIEQFSYLRGLDGQTTAESKAKSRTSSQGSDSQREQDKPKDQNLSELQKPEGNSQLDYIPRLAWQLHEKEREWIRRNPRHQERLDAIGVLGSDVYDKLLLLQSLRQHFPDAIFFTTDLDARLFHTSQLRWTRNVIVASSFGLHLRDDLQKTVAPFRDSYQTAQYLACLHALGGTNELTAENKPRCFEIGRNGPVDLSANIGAVHPLPHAFNALGVREVHTLLAEIALVAVLGWAFVLAIFPRSRNIIGGFFKDETRGNLVVVGVCGVVLLSIIVHPAFLLGVVAICSGSFALRGPVPASVAAKSQTEGEWKGNWKAMLMRSRSVLTIAASVTLLLLYLMVWLVARDNVKPDGQPFSMFDGISLWPSEIVRLIAVLLTVGFLIKARFDWHKEIKDAAKIITSRASSDSSEPGENLIDPPVTQEHAGAKKWWELFDLSKWPTISVASMERPTIDGTQDGKIDGWKLWTQYKQLGYQPFRYARAARTALFAILFALSLTFFFPIPPIPHRGSLALRLDYAVLGLSVVGLLILTFYVTDATHLCAKFIENLTGTETDWSRPNPENNVAPASTPSERGADLNRDGTATRAFAKAYLTDINLIADRTESLGKMIYYPFIIILLMFLARNAVFAAWHWSLYLYIIFTLNIAYACVAAFSLRGVAEQARRDSLKALKSKLLEALESKQDTSTIKYLKVCITQVEQKCDGAFAPLFRQPIFKAVLMPFGGAGVITALQYLLGQ